MRRRAFVIGGTTLPFIGKGHPNFIHPKHPLFGQKNNPTLKEYIVNSINETLNITSVDPKLIQRVFVANFAGELFCNQGHLGSAVAEANEALYGIPSMRIEGACASGGLAFESAITSIQAGNDIVLVIGAEVQNTVSARVGGDYLARASDYERERPLDDFTFPALFAKRKKLYLEKFKNVSDSDIDRISVKAYHNANLNPLAHMNSVKITPEKAKESPNFLGNEELKPFLKLTDCSQVSDGASGLIVVSEEGLKKLGKKLTDTVEIIACEIATGNLYSDRNVDWTKLGVTEIAANRAYQKSGISPNQIHVAEVHDCFNIAEVQMVEALGFAKYGEGAFIDSGLDGKIPINTGGGLIGFGHPVGATGVKQIVEIWKQMKGLAGNYQIKKSLDYGLCANMGGNDRTAVVTILKNH